MEQHLVRIEVEAGPWLFGGFQQKDEPLGAGVAFGGPEMDSCKIVIVFWVSYLPATISYSIYFIA
jgi:hypothetical protein